MYPILECVPQLSVVVTAGPSTFCMSVNISLHISYNSDGLPIFIGSLQNERQSCEYFITYRALTGSNISSIIKYDLTTRSHFCSKKNPLLSVNPSIYKKIINSTEYVTTKYLAINHNSWQMGEREFYTLDSVFQNAFYSGEFFSYYSETYIFID